MTYTRADHDSTPMQTCLCANCQGLGPESFPGANDWKKTWATDTGGFDWPAECPPHWEGLDACTRCARFHTQPWCPDGVHYTAWKAATA